ncbi:MAG: ATP-binding protein [Beijerinckiaceae bacterium]
MKEQLHRWLKPLDSLAARTILVVLVAIGALHLLSLWTYRHALHQQATASNDERLAGQLVTIKRAIMREPFEQRESVAHDLSGGPLEAHWSRTEHARPGGPGSAHLGAVADRIRAFAPELGDDDLILGANRRSEDDPHLALISMRLPDRSWVNVSVVRTMPQSAEGHGTLLSTTLMALGALAVAILLVRWLTRPLTSLAGAAKAFSGTGQLAVSEDGPRELRELAAAFNEMQQRISRLVTDRTEALAAVSHDLKTPITRLRFRAEAVPDPAVRQAMAGDLAEMERMIDQTLTYLRGDPEDEDSRPVDLVAILETITNDFTDTGADVALEGSRRGIVQGRRLALKRAMGNLVGNAVKYGRCARISVADGDMIAVTIADSGPGIPEGDRQRALEPFVRLEPSRNAETGGFGLGLTIAHDIIRHHGGTLDLADGAESGLLVTIRLPRAVPNAP